MKIKRTYFSTKQEVFVPFIKYGIRSIFNENYALVPRFTIKQENIISEMPIGKKLKYDQNLMIKAIQNGMIILISYRGEDDNWKGGRERTIYPMVLGTSKAGMPLLRAWHLIGWSLSKARVVEKEWRMLRTDRIKSMTFTGGFFRLPPDGYKSNDEGIANIIKWANFNEIRSNQENLVKASKIQAIEDAELASAKLIYNIKVENLNYNFDLNNPYDDTYIKRDTANITRLTLLKGVMNTDYYLVIGASGEKNGRAKLWDAKTGNLIGVFVAVDSFMGDEINKNKMGTLNNVPIQVFLYKGKK